MATNKKTDNKGVKNGKKRRQGKMAPDSHFTTTHRKRPPGLHINSFLNLSARSFFLSLPVSF